MESESRVYLNECTCIHCLHLCVLLNCYPRQGLIPAYNLGTYIHDLELARVRRLPMQYPTYNNIPSTYLSIYSRHDCNGLTRLSITSHTKSKAAMMCARTLYF